MNESLTDSTYLKLALWQKLKLFLKNNVVNKISWNF